MAVSRLLAAAELGGYLTAICYMQFKQRFQLPGTFDFFAVAMILLGVAVSVSEKSALSGFFNRRVCFFLGRFSLYPFLTFMLWAKTLPVFLPDVGIKPLTVIYLGVTLASAALLMAIEKPFVNLVKAAAKRIATVPREPEQENAAQ